MDKNGANFTYFISYDSKWVLVTLYTCQVKFTTVYVQKGQTANDILQTVFSTCKPKA